MSLILFFPTSSFIHHNKLSYPVQVSLILLFPTSSFIHHIFQLLLHHIDSKNRKYGKHSKTLNSFVSLFSIKMLVVRPRGYKTFLCSTQLSTKFNLLINVKMPTIVGIFTFISMINTTSERLKARNFFICWYFSFYEQLKFHAQMS